MKSKTVLLGLSGGVDSTVAAVLLKNQGYNIIAAFMKNFSDTKNPYTGECSYLEDKAMAQKICSQLNIPFIYIDSEKQYKSKVIDKMFKDYKKNLTPNPDADCNKEIKFPELIKAAKKVKADFIATGHYAKIKLKGNEAELHIPKDKNHDQTYFLWSLSQKDLKKTLFPLSNLTKEEVRALANKLDMPNSNKKGSRGICFVGKVDMKSFLEKKIKNKKGIVKDPEGNILGTHPGTFYFTIGQRIGERLGIEINKQSLKSSNVKFYVAEKKKNNTLIVAPEYHPILKKKFVYITKFNHLNKNEKIPSNLKARIRHLSPLISGKLSKEKNKLKFTFSKPLEQIAEGQSIVLYHKTKVIGGGEIRLK